MSPVARLFLIPLSFFWATAFAGETEELTGLLDHFLENVAEVDAHERFWAEDLVYTSSSGERTTKTTIVKSVKEASNEAVPGPRYTAEDVEVKIYGTTAVVAFRLVATPRGDSGVTEYLNTGTFLKRGDIWQVVAWQATRVPL